MKRLKTVIANSVDFSFSLNLPADTSLVQHTGFTGARVQHLRDNIVDIEPDLLMLIVGTNDLYDQTAETTAAIIFDSTIFTLNVPQVVLCQTIYRVEPTRLSRCPVNVIEFASKVESLNQMLNDNLVHVSSSLSGD